MIKQKFKHSCEMLFVCYSSISKEKVLRHFLGRDVEEARNYYCVLSPISTDTLPVINYLCILDIMQKKARTTIQ